MSSDCASTTGPAKVCSLVRAPRCAAAHPPRRAEHVYETVTMGAPAAHHLGFKRGGGLARLRPELRASDPGGPVAAPIGPTSTAIASTATTTTTPTASAAAVLHATAMVLIGDATSPARASPASGAPPTAASAIGDAAGAASSVGVSGGGATCDNNGDDNTASGSSNNNAGGIGDGHDGDRSTGSRISAAQSSAAGVGGSNSSSGGSNRRCSAVMQCGQHSISRLHRLAQIVQQAALSMDTVLDACGSSDRRSDMHVTANALEQAAINLARHLPPKTAQASATVRRRRR